MRKFVAILLAVLGVYVLACEFHFDPASYTGKLGDTFVLTVTVVKTHRRCVITMDDYEFEFKNVQLLALTPWKEVSNGTYQRKFLLSLARVGDGYVKISKNCSREGYQEAFMRVKIEPNADVLKKVQNKEIPFKTDLKVVKANLILEEKVFTSEDKKEITLEKIDLEKASYKLPFRIDLPTNQKIYVLYSTEFKYPILIASDSILYRFDYYILASK